MSNHDTVYFKVKNCMYNFTIFIKTLDDKKKP